MAIKLKALVLAALLTLSSVAQVTAGHKDLPFAIPHDIAAWATENDVRIRAHQRTVTEGCETVLTWTAFGSGDQYIGYMIMVGDSSPNPRLVAMEMWDKLTDEKVLSYVNREDYNALKACHQSELK